MFDSNKNLNELSAEQRVSALYKKKKKKKKVSLVHTATQQVNDKF